MKTLIRIRDCLGKISKASLKTDEEKRLQVRDNKHCWKEEIKPFLVVSLQNLLQTERILKN